MAFIINSKQLEQLKAIEKIAETTYGRRTIKVNLMDRIKEAVQVRWDRLKKVETVIDEIMYRLTDRGFCFTGRERLAQVCKCSLSTVDKAIRYIKESDMFVVCYRNNPGSNGYKTPVIIATIHKNYKEISSVLGLEFLEENLEQKKKRVKAIKNKEENKVESVSNAYQDWLEGAKKVSTNLFTIKQELNNKYIYSTDLIRKVSNLSTDNVIRYIALKIEDYKSQGGKINHLSSFIEKTFAHVVKTSGLMKGIEASIEANNKPTEAIQEPYKPSIKVPFYNWLEER